MGVTRKALSVATVGLIDFRSDKERIARSARLTKEAVKAGNKELRKQTKLIKKLASAALKDGSHDATNQSSEGWYAAAGRIPVASAGPARVPPPQPLLMELAALHERGSLTDVEFTAAKAQLLGLPTGTSSDTKAGTE